MIRVAKDGYEGTLIPGHQMMWIDGLLHQRMTEPSGADMWLPVMEWSGPVRIIDRRGWPVADLPASPAPEGGRERGEKL